MNEARDLDALRASFLVCCPGAGDEALVPAELPLRRVTADVELRAMACAGRSTVLWLVPRGPDSPPLAANNPSWLGGMGQALLDLASGRYVVDVHDAATGALISREIATASPLVIGLPWRGQALLVRIEPIG